MNTIRKVSLNDLENLLNIKIEISEEEFYLCFNYLISKLNEQECRIIKQRFYEKRTLENIGNIEHLSKERVRQIILRGLRKIRFYKENRILLSKGFEYYITEKAKKEKENFKNDLVNKYAYLEDIVMRYQDEFNRFNELCHNNESFISLTDILTYDINTLDFTVRTYNCLRRYGIKTVLDLSKLSKVELIRIKNLGRKSYKEIIDKLKKYNIELKDTDEVFL